MGPSGCKKKSPTRKRPTAILANTSSPSAWRKKLTESFARTRSRTSWKRNTLASRSIPRFLRSKIFQDSIIRRHLQRVGSAPGVRAGRVLSFYSSASAPHYARARLLDRLCVSLITPRCPTLLALQKGRRAVYLGGDVLNRSGDDDDLLAGLLPVVLLDGLARAGQRLDAVARVEAGRVNLVLEPGTARQARVARHRGLDAHPNLVERALRLARAQALLRRGTTESRLVVLRALLKARERVL